MKWFFSFVVCFLVVGCQKQTCAPDTLERLSKMPPIDHPTSSAQFAKLLHTTSSGTWDNEIEKVWNQLYPDHHLSLVIQKTDNTLYGASGIRVDYNEPNLWTGQYEGKGHCCLIYICPDDVVLSHSQFVPGTTNYYTERKPLVWMVTNSWYKVYVVK